MRFKIEDVLIPAHINKLTPAFIASVDMKDGECKIGLIIQDYKAGVVIEEGENCIVFMRMAYCFTVEHSGYVAVNEMGVVRSLTVKINAVGMEEEVFMSIALAVSKMKLESRGK